MRTPYDRYIRFLITRGKESADSTNAVLKDLGLPEITDDEFDAQFDLVFDSVPKAIAKQIESQKFEGDFLKHMAVLDVKELWQYERKEESYRFVKLVYDIHYDPRLKIALNALLIKGMRTADLCQTLNLKFSSMLKVEHVELYEKFFWSVSRMSRQDWKRYIKKCKEFEQSILFTCFSDDIETVKASLELPAKTAVPDMLQYLLSQSYQKAKHYLRFSSKDQNMEARLWIEQTMKLSDRYEKHRTGNMEDFGKSLQMEFDYVDADFMTPDEQMRADVARREQSEEGAEK
jgi:hypothetical protein